MPATRGFVHEIEHCTVDLHVGKAISSIASVASWSPSLRGYFYGVGTVVSGTGKKSGNLIIVRQNEPDMQRCVRIGMSLNQHDAAVRGLVALRFYPLCTSAMITRFCRDPPCMSDSEDIVPQRFIQYSRFRHSGRIRGCVLPASHRK